VPTTRPRYTLTDTGALEAMLDAAQRRWPEITDRKALLLRLIEEGSNALDDHDAARKERSERAQQAIDRIASLVDVDVILSDQAWR
jgi:hypothetical protein